MIKKKFLVNLFKFYPFRKSFNFALEGITYLFLYHRNMRIIFISGIVAFLLGIIFNLGLTQISLLCITIALVFVAEMFNTSIELIIDHLTEKKYHALVKVVKDIAAAVVLIASLNALAVGYFLFWEKILELFVK